MGVRSGVSSSTPERIIIDAGAVYIDYGLGTQRLLGATRGGNEFNTNRVARNIEVDGPKGPVKGMKRVSEVGPQITANLIELSVENLIAAIAGANQSDRGYIEAEHILGAAQTEFDLDQNDIIENSERVYVKRPDGATGTGAMVLQNRSKKYASRFVGTNAANNKGFVDGIGNWTQDAFYDAPVIAVGGYPGNCLLFTGKVGSTTQLNFLNLPATGGAVLTNLVVGQYYRLQIVAKRGATWDGGVVTVACDDGSIPITLTTDWVTYVITFLASGADATISLTCTTAPLAADTMSIDNLELERVDYPSATEITAGQVGYVVKLDGGDAAGAKGSIVFMSALTASPDDEVIVSYAYELATPGTHTTITGGEIADADYMTNVAIVGNVSGKTNPVICIINNVLADAPGLALSLAPRDEAVPVVVFTGHYAAYDLDTEPWEVRWPNS